MSLTPIATKRPPSPTDKDDVKKKKNIDAQYALELKLSEPSERPSVGTAGRKLPNTALLHYGFVVVPDAKTPLKTKLFSQLASQGTFGNTSSVFDGNSAIYTCVPLPIGDDKEFSIQISLPAEGRMKEKKFLVTIRKIEKIEMDRLIEYLKEKCIMTSQIPTCITILNTVLNYGPRKNFAVVKQGIFPDDFNERPIILTGGIELKIGFCQSMRPGWDNMLVNVDVCAGLFYPAVSLIEFCRQILNKHDVNDLRRGINDYEMRELERAFKGIKVRVTHRGDRKPVIKVERLSSKAADDLYFKNEKEGQRYEKTLSDRARADMIRKTALPPQDRFHQIEEGIHHVFNHKNDENLKDFGIEVDSKMMVQIIIIIIPKKSCDIYGKIKRISDTELGIPTQCILSDKLRRPNNKACWNNIALKVNAKLGGRNSTLVEGQLEYVTNIKIPTMIMGADISHPGPGQTMQPSIAAVCASMDVNGTTYCGQVSVNEERRNETIENNKNNGCLPHRMIFYRDGVSEGQFSGVVKKEVIAIKRAFEKLYEQGKAPLLTFIVAQKKHHT
ncbi:10267_t:CDS:2, partial [Racocetra fulgida]